MPVPAGSVHAYTLTKPSRAGAIVSRSELVELGAATCLGGIVRPALLTEEGTEKQEKLCCRCRTAVVVVVAPVMTAFVFEFYPTKPNPICEYS